MKDITVCREDGINVQQKSGSQIDYRFFLGIKLVCE